MSEDELTGYEGEPREIFEPLPARLHAFYYHHERLSGDLDAELSYYRAAFPQKSHRLLELGCGTSLISSHFVDHGFSVTGIDLDHDMLAFQPRHQTGTAVQMDMCALGFRPCFNGALIAHNTLNLLVEEQKIRQCLRGLRRVMISPSILVAHVYVDSPENPVSEQKQLQFQVFELPAGEKIVKESITSRKTKQAGRDVLQIEQRYKYRNFTNPRLNRNYHQLLELALLDADEWLTIFNESGFMVTATSSGFTTNHSNSASTLIVTAQT